MDARGAGSLARAGSAILRPLDRHRAAEATKVAGISEFVKQRIADAWNVHADVIYPPVETSYLQGTPDWRTRLTGDELAMVDSLPAEFILGASRFIPYKRLDLVIDAGERSGFPVVLAGGGPERARLASRAGEAKVPVTFVDDPSNPLLYALYQAASVFVFPPVEDFGIMPVEAMALGTPVVAAWAGGSAETVIEGVSGVHFEGETPADIARAIQEAMDLSGDDCRRASLRFSRETFNAAFGSWMQASIGGARAAPAI
jgi:glycosyltransferase involved in cell wall biosynthesis